MLRKSLVVFSLIILCLLSACSKDPLSKQIVTEIEDIGDVTLDDEELISDLEETYSQMTDKQKDQVENYVDLREARKKLDKLKEEESEKVAEAERKEEAEVQEQLASILSSKPYSGAISLCKAIKSSLYNPESFQLHAISYNESVFEYYKVDYSGENKLGGTVRGTLIAELRNGDLKKIYEENDSEYADREKYNFGDGNTVITLDEDFILEYMDADYQFTPQTEDEQTKETEPSDDNSDTDNSGAYYSNEKACAKVAINMLAAENPMANINTIETTVMENESLNQAYDGRHMYFVKVTINYDSSEETSYFLWADTHDEIADSFKSAESGANVVSSHSFNESEL